MLCEKKQLFTLPVSWHWLRTLQELQKTVTCNEIFGKPLVANAFTGVLYQQLGQSEFIIQKASECNEPLDNYPNISEH